MIIAQLPEYKNKSAEHFSLNPDMKIFNKGTDLSL